MVGLRPVPQPEEALDLVASLAHFAEAFVRTCRQVQALWMDPGHMRGTPAQPESLQLTHGLHAFRSSPISAASSPSKNAGGRARPGAPDCSHCPGLPPLPQSILV